MAKKFEVTILGVNSAYPVHGRHPSCQIVNYDEKFFMIDCGEAAQIQVSKYSIKRGRINHIFISHLHGDHCYGLPGLLTSYSLQGRKSPMYVHGPFGIKKYINDVFEASRAFMSFDLNVIEYDTEKWKQDKSEQVNYGGDFSSEAQNSNNGFQICGDVR